MVETAVFCYGPYDVSSYAGWKTALTDNVITASTLTAVKFGDKIIFIEVRAKPT